MAESTVAQPQQHTAHQVVNPPGPLNVSDTNSIDQWKTFKQLWENYAIITDLDKHNQKYQLAMFLHAIGPDFQSLMNLSCVFISVH